MNGARGIIEGWMRRARPVPLLYLPEFFYAGAVRVRKALYNSGVLKKKTLPCPVVSVGNLTAGGSGKTPAAMMIAEILSKAGLKPAILSRGYGGSSAGTAVVSDGVNTLLSPAEAGDEPYLMARRLKGLPVIVGPDRHSSGICAIERFGSDAMELDDGFQHIRLRRDANILVIDAEVGFGNGRLLPAGILREPTAGVRRADIVLVKGGGLKPYEDSIVRRFNLKTFAFSYRAAAFTDVASGREFPPDSFRGKSVCAFAGIANPSSLFFTLTGTGLCVITRLPYPDHYPYSQKDLDVVYAASKGADVIVTTEKDAVKLAGFRLSGPVYYLRVEAVLEKEPEFTKALTELLESRAHLG